MAEKKTAEKNSSKENLDEVKFVAALAYFGILFFLPLVTFPKSKFGKFHANQGLILLIFSAVGNMLGGNLSFFGGHVIWNIFSFVTFIFFIIGVVNALNKEEKRLPVIGGFDLI